MPAVYAALARDEPRNEMIFDDVLKSLEAKRSPIVLTERRDHLEYLQGRFSRFVRHLVVLRGGMSATERRASGIIDIEVVASCRRIGRDFERDGFRQIENAGLLVPGDDAKVFITSAALAWLHSDLGTMVLPEGVESIARLVLEDAQ